MVSGTIKSNESKDYDNIVSEDEGTSPFITLVVIIPVGNDLDCHFFSTHVHYPLACCLAWSQHELMEV